MKTIEYTTVDKSKYPTRGAWDNEPDKKQWQDEETGLACLIHRGPVGALCGYVGVPEGHPYFKKSYNDIDHLEVHYGLTYSGLCQPGTDESKGICHLPDEGEPDHVWWLGFDCAHSDDFCPSYQKEAHSIYSSYKDIPFVESECRGLAKQLLQVATNHE